MKLKIALLLLAFSTSFVAFGQHSKYLPGVTENPAIQKHLDEVNAKIADTTYLFSAIPSTPLGVSDRDEAPQHFPYPILFIHGLIGCADSWIDFYNSALSQGWSYGGHVRFNLNSDNNFFYSNIFSASQSDVKDFNTNLPAADFYLVNFNCGLDGTSYSTNYNTPTQSNQAAIVKQGLALKLAVKRILDATGKDKVILMGHSMGGLAARQYLQNSNLWQADGKHHIAKIVTTGTPHGGSNASFPGISGFYGVDESSDAVRDLRRSYFYSGDPGVYLFGGAENESVMNDLLAGFYNYDVNCNGAESNIISGLNQKSMPSDLDFACIFSDYNLDPLGGDLVVGTTEAQLKSYYNILCETFEINVPHTNMPKNTKVNVEGLDEPDYYDLSYKIEPNTTYNGFITKQAPDAEYAIDYDDFVFTTTQPGWISVHADNIASYPFGITILDHPNYNYLFDQTYQNDPIQTQALFLQPGTYYLEFYANGSSISWQYPYSFKLGWSPNNPTATTEADSNFELNISPNPVTQYAIIKIENSAPINGILQVRNEVGLEVYRAEIEGTQIEKQINLEDFPAGVYFVSIKTENKVATRKLIKN